MNNKQLVILAGGKGSRLLGETKHRPKPLVELFNNTTTDICYLDEDPFTYNIENRIISEKKKGDSPPLDVFTTPFLILVVLHLGL